MVHKQKNGFEMTCIAAIIEDGKIWMGCDRLVTAGDHAVKIDTKLVKKDNILMGFSGRLRDINLIRFGFELPKHDKKISDDEYMATVFTTAVRERLKEFGAAKVQYGEEISGAYILIGYNKRLYKMYYDFGVAKIEDADFYSIGSGKSVALGSLHTTEGIGLAPEQRLLKALEAAQEYVPSVRGPFIIECL